MGSNGQSEARRLRSRLDHPIIDADGHWLEFAPVMREEFRRIGERKNSKSPFAVTNLSPFPLPRATIAPPEGEVKRPARAMPLGGAQQGGEPARLVPSLRSKPGATRARTEAVGRGRRENLLAGTLRCI